MREVMQHIFVFFVEGPADLDKQSKKVDTALQIPSMPNRHGGGYKSKSANQASPPPPRYRCKCMETHRMCSRVAVGALPMPCKCIATGSKCFQSGRTTCQHGPGQALCSRLPCLMQCRGGLNCCLDFTDSYDPSVRPQTLTVSA